MNYRLLVPGVFSADYSYISKWVVQLLSSAKNWPTHEPCCTPPRKIPLINVVKPFYECQQSVLKILRLLCRLGLQLGLVWLVSGNNLLALCIAISWMKYITLSCTICCPLTMYTTDNQQPELTLCTYKIGRFCTRLRIHSNSHNNNAVTIRPVTGTIAYALYIRLPEL